MLKTMLLNNLTETMILFRIPGLIESKINRKKIYLYEYNYIIAVWIYLHNL